jgi:hypothetical protein
VTTSGRTGCRLEPAGLVVEVSQTPDAVADLLDADILTGEHEAEIDFPAVEADPHVVTVTILLWNG